MNPNNYYLRGSINSGSRVLLATTQNNILYFLTTNGTNLVFDPRNPLLLGSPSVPSILTLTETNDTQISLALSSGGKLAVNNQTGYAVLSTAATPLFPSTGNVNFPDLIVAGGEYEFSTNSVNEVNFYAYVPTGTTGSTGSTGSTGTTGIQSVFASSIEVDDTGNPILQTFNSNIRIVPTKWFTNGNCSQTPSSTSIVIQDEALWVLSQKSVFVGFPTGFTSQQECTNNVFYDYCTAGETCGTGNCNGTCSNTNQSCNLNNDNNFVCSSSSSSSSWWIWLIVGIIALLILILLIVAIYYAFRTPTAQIITTTTPTSTIYTQPYLPQQYQPIEYSTIEYGSY
jgi:hypothetical protein